MLAHFFDSPVTNIPPKPTDHRLSDISSDKSIESETEIDDVHYSLPTNFYSDSEEESVNNTDEDSVKGIGEKAVPEEPEILKMNRDLLIKKIELEPKEPEQEKPPEQINFTGLSPDSQTKVIFSAGGCDFLQGAIICSNCKSIINPPLAYIKKIYNKKPTFICQKCMIDEEKHCEICYVCKHILNKGERIEVLRNDLKIHAQCLHCFQCGCTPSQGGKFQAVQVDGKYIVLCVSCANFVNGTSIDRNDKVIVGRLAKEFRQKKKDMRCTGCNKTFVGGFYALINGKALCSCCHQMTK